VTLAFLLLVLPQHPSGHHDNENGYRQRQWIAATGELGADDEGWERAGEERWGQAQQHDDEKEPNDASGVVWLLVCFFFFSPYFLILMYV
jgi:hypothetical protein